MGNANAGSVSEFEEITTLAKGAQGSVIAVVERSTGRQFAMKRIPYGIMDSQTKERALQEAQVLRQREHKNVVSFYKFWDEPGRIYGGTICIVMEYMAGGSMKDLLRLRISQKKPFSRSELLNFFNDMLDGVAHLHFWGILHRDIKLANLLLAKNHSRLKENDRNILKICDLGLARDFSSRASNPSSDPKLAPSENGKSSHRKSNSELHRRQGSRVSITNAKVGTPNIFEGKPYSFPADVYSLGVCFRELLTLKNIEDCFTPHGILQPEFLSTPLPLISIGTFLSSFIISYSVPIFPQTIASSILYSFFSTSLIWYLGYYRNELSRLINEMMAREPKNRPTLEEIRRRIYKFEETEAERKRLLLVLGVSVVMYSIWYLVAVKLPSW